MGGQIRGVKRRQQKEELREIAREVRAVYDALAHRPVTRACELRTECCHFKLTGRTPFLTKGEALVAARALRATGRKTLPDRADGACPLLAEETGRCLIYNDRPFGCRTHFCKAAGGPYHRSEVADLIQTLEKIGAEWKEARPLAAAVELALEEIS